MIKVSSDLLILETKVITMKRTRIMAATLAAACLTAIYPVLPAEAADTAKLPEWVPQSYLDAVQFRNDYGATCNDGTYVCIVFRENETNPKDEIPRYKVVTTEGVLKEVSHKTLTAPEDVMTGVQYEWSSTKPPKQANLRWHWSTPG